MRDASLLLQEVRSRRSLYILTLDKSLSGLLCIEFQGLGSLRLCMTVMLAMLVSGSHWGA